MTSLTVNFDFEELSVISESDSSENMFRWFNYLL